jgi:asparagine synthase (glutamine-hydrolysing)
MCGIYGYLLKQGAGSAEALAAARERLRHRGPDEQGLFEDANIALGHTRLSIIDLSSGQQPMHSADGRYVIVFNGEIYNFQELRERIAAAGGSLRTNSDTEVILALYASRGEDCVLDLRGMFAFAIYDRRERSLFLARDRLGVKPLFYAESPAGFFFASELPALLALCPELARDWNWDALTDYFARQYILGPLTAYRNARKLQPGHTLLIKNGGSAGTPQRYWFPERIAARQRSRQEAREELRALFFEATKLRLISEVPLGAFLSGGVDSSITVAVMAQLLGRKFSTYSIGFNDAKFDETKFARRVAEHCGTEHHEQILEYNKELPSILTQLIRHFGEPFGDTSIIPTFYVAKAARRGLTVVLSGDGADEIWGGYKRHYYAATLTWLKQHHLRAFWLGTRRGVKALESMFGGRKPFPANQLDRLLLARESIAESLTCKFDATARAEFFAASELHAANQAYSFVRSGPDNPQWNDLERFLFYDLNTFLASDVLPKVDIATMMNSLEARSPFLDQQVVEFAFSLTPDLRRPRLKEGKSLVKETIADLLPPGHFNRPKMGFSPPLASWLRTLLRDWCGDLLSSGVCKAWLNQSLLQQWFGEHQQGCDHSRRLWTAAVFCQWAQLQDSFSR